MQSSGKYSFMGANAGKIMLQPAAAASKFAIPGVSDKLTEIAHSEFFNIANVLL